MPALVAGIHELNKKRHRGWIGSGLHIWLWPGCHHQSPQRSQADRSAPSATMHSNRPMNFRGLTITLPDTRPTMRRNCSKFPVTEALRAGPAAQPESV